MFNMFANYKKTQSKLPKELKTFAKVAKKIQLSHCWLPPLSLSQRGCLWVSSYASITSLLFQD